MAQSEADVSVLSRRVSHGRPLLPLGDGQMQRPQGPGRKAQRLDFARSLSARELEEDTIGCEFSWTK